MTASFPLRITAHTAVSALGAGLLAHEQALEANRSGLSPLSADGDGTAPVVGQLDTWVGRVDGLDQPLPSAWQAWDCRNHRLAWKALQLDGFAQAVNQAVATHGADRVAVVDAGRITEIGPHADLVAAGGDYAALWRSWQQE